MALFAVILVAGLLLLVLKSAREQGDDWARGAARAIVAPALLALGAFGVLRALLPGLLLRLGIGAAAAAASTAWLAAAGAIAVLWGSAEIRALVRGALPAGGSSGPPGDGSGCPPGTVLGVNAQTGKYECIRY
jgi:hypothetical protein